MPLKKYYCWVWMRNHCNVTGYWIFSVILLALRSKFLDVHPMVQRDMQHTVWHHVVHLSVRQHLANPHCTPQSTKALDPRISLWKHKERRVSVSTHWHMFISTNNSDRGDHNQTVAKHRTWAENGFSQQAIVIVRLISGFHQSFSRSFLQKSK